MFRFSYFSWIRSVLFSFMSGSGLSDLWPHFFVHVRLRSFGSMTPPCIFWPFLSCFTSSCVVSVRISVRLFCVPFKGKKIRWPSLSFFRSCPAPVFPIYAPPPPTPSVPFYLYCICEGGGGRGQGGPWPMGDSGSCSGVLKYAVTWYCISTFTSLHRGLEGWGGGGESGETRIEWWGEDRETNLKRNNFDITV